MFSKTSRQWKQEVPSVTVGIIGYCLNCISLVPYNYETQGSEYGLIQFYRCLCIKNLHLIYLVNLGNWCFQVYFSVNGGHLSWVRCVGPWAWLTWQIRGKVKWRGYLAFPHHLQNPPLETQLPNLTSHLFSGSHIWLFYDFFEALVVDFGGRNEKVQKRCLKWKCCISARLAIQHWPYELGQDVQLFELQCVLQSGRDGAHESSMG